MKITKKVTRPAIALSVAIVLGACAAGGVYKQNKWSHFSNEADWDIDSAVCLQHSDNLTPEDLAEIEEIKILSQHVAGSVSDSATQLADAYGDSQVGSVISGVAGIFGGAKSSTAEEQVKEKKFSTCMEKKNWSKE